MSEETQYWYLRNHKLFSSLSSADVRSLCIISKYKTAKKNDIIYFAEDPDSRIYLLKRGKIRIMETDSHGNELVKEILRTGDIFGEITLSSQPDVHGEFAQVMSDEVIICSFKKEDFEEVLENKPHLAVQYTKFIGFKFKRLKNRYANMVFKDVKSRMMHFLKEWMENEGEKTLDGRIVIQNYLTQQDIANLICATRQTATQLLNEMERDGILRYDRRQVVIEKPELVEIKKD